MTALRALAEDLAVHTQKTHADEEIINPLFKSAVDAVFELDGRGYRLELNVQDKPYEALLKISQSLHEFGLSHNIANEFVEAIEAQAVHVGVDFTKKAKPTPMEISLYVMDKEPELSDDQDHYIVSWDGMQKFGGDYHTDTVVEMHIDGTRSTRSNVPKFEDMFKIGGKKYLTVHLKKLKESGAQTLDEKGAELANFVEAVGPAAAGSAGGGAMKAQIENGTISPAMTELIGAVAETRHVIETAKFEPPSDKNALKIVDLNNKIVTQTHLVASTESIPSVVAKAVSKVMDQGAAVVQPAKASIEALPRQQNVAPVVAMNENVAVKSAAPVPAAANIVAQPALKEAGIPASPAADSAKVKSPESGVAEKAATVTTIKMGEVVATIPAAAPDAKMPSAEKSTPAVPGQAAQDGAKPAVQNAQPVVKVENSATPPVANNQNTPPVAKQPEGGKAPTSVKPTEAAATVSVKQADVKNATSPATKAADAPPTASSTTVAKQGDAPKQQPQLNQPAPSQKPSDAAKVINTNGPATPAAPVSKSVDAANPVKQEVPSTPSKQGEATAKQSSTQPNQPASVQKTAEAPKPVESTGKQPVSPPSNQAAPVQKAAEVPKPAQPANTPAQTAKPAEAVTSPAKPATAAAVPTKPVESADRQPASPPSNQAAPAQKIVDAPKPMPAANVVSTSAQAPTLSDGSKNSGAGVSPAAKTIEVALKQPQPFSGQPVSKQAEILRPAPTLPVTPPAKIVETQKSFVSAAATGSSVTAKADSILKAHVQPSNAPQPNPIATDPFRTPLTPVTGTKPVEIPVTAKPSHPLSQMSSGTFRSPPAGNPPLPAPATVTPKPTEYRKQEPIPASQPQKPTGTVKSFVATAPAPAPAQPTVKIPSPQRNESPRPPQTPPVVERTKPAEPAPFKKAVLPEQKTAPVGGSGHGPVEKQRSVETPKPTYTAPPRPHEPLPVQNKAPYTPPVSPSVREKAPVQPPSFKPKDQEVFQKEVSRFGSDATRDLVKASREKEIPHHVINDTVPRLKPEDRGDFIRMINRETTTINIPDARNEKSYDTGMNGGGGHKPQRFIDQIRSDAVAPVVSKDRTLYGDGPTRPPENKLKETFKSACDDCKNGEKRCPACKIDPNALNLRRG